jgi:hypothetical protein|tara:strand:- start:235 stop:816 length:582 start_codon:yes stop_codon:yes gene_type:complete
MHENRWKNSELSEYLIELSQVQFNPSDFLKLTEQYEFKQYINAYGYPTPQELCYEKELLEESIVQHYLNIFKDFDLRQSDVNSKLSSYPEKTELKGWLVKSDMSEKELQVHTDMNRPAAMIFPLTFPQSLNLHESEKSGISYVYEYSPTIIMLNSGSKWHSVSQESNTRYQFQFDCYNSWEEIKELAENLSLV